MYFKKLCRAADPKKVLLWGIYNTFSILLQQLPGSECCHPFSSTSCPLYYPPHPFRFPQFPTTLASTVPFSPPSSFSPPAGSYLLLIAPVLLYTDHHHLTSFLFVATTSISMKQRELAYTFVKGSSIHLRPLPWPSLTIGSHLGC